MDPFKHWFAHSRNLGDILHTKHRAVWFSQAFWGDNCMVRTEDETVYDGLTYTRPILNERANSIDT